MVLKDNSRNTLGICLFFIFIFFTIIISNEFAPKSDNEFFKQKYQELANFIENNFDNEEKQKQYFNSKQQKTNITFWHNLYPQEQYIMKKIIQNFEKNYPNIQIVETSKGNWNQIVKSISHALPVNKQPNLAFSYPDYVAFYSKSHKVIPLDIFTEYDKDFLLNTKSDPFLPGYLPKMELKEEYDGKPHYYYLPFLKSTDIMFYNGDALREIKMEIKKKIVNNKDDIQLEELNNIISEEGIIKEQFTWTQLEKLCQIMKEYKKDKKDFIPIIIDSEPNLFFVSIAQQQRELPKDKDEIKEFLNKPENQQIMEYFKKKFYDKGYLTVANLSGLSDSSQFFLKQNAYMHISSTRRLDKLSNSNFNTEMTSIPTFCQNSMNCSNSNILQGANINLFYSQDQDEMLASWLFLKHLVSSENAIKMIQDKGGITIFRQKVKDFFNFKKEILRTEMELLKKQIKQTKQKTNSIMNKILKNKFIIDYALKITDKNLNNLEETAVKLVTTTVFDNSSYFRDIIALLFTEVLIIDSDQEPNITEKIKDLFNTAEKIMSTN